MLQLTTLALAGVLVIMGCAISARRLWRASSTRVEERRQGRLRPLVMACISVDEPDLRPLERVLPADVPTLEALIWHLLTKVRGAVRMALVEWLIECGAVERARARTHSRDPVRRAIAAERLGDAGVLETSADTTRLLDDRYADVRIVAARALGKLGNGAAVPDLLATLESPRPVPAGIVSMALVHLGPVAVDGLAHSLGSRSAVVRGVCADLLGLHGALQAAKWLSLLVEHDPDPDVRARSAVALGRIGFPQSAEVLRRACAALPSNPIAVRCASLRALGRVGGGPAVAALQVAIDDVDDDIGQAAAEGLAAIGAPGVRVLTMVGLAEGVGRERAQDWLIRVSLENDSRQRRAARRPRPRVVAP